jgi:hypothetical protein
MANFFICLSLSIYNPCNCREKGITNKDFLSTFGKMIKNKTLKEVHNYFIEILGFDEKSSGFSQIVLLLGGSLTQDELYTGQQLRDLKPKKKDIIMSLNG